MAGSLIHFERGAQIDDRTATSVDGDSDPFSGATPDDVDDEVTVIRVINLQPSMPSPERPSVASGEGSLLDPLTPSSSPAPTASSPRSSSLTTPVHSVATKQQIAAKRLRRARRTPRVQTQCTSGAAHSDNSNSSRSLFASPEEIVLADVSINAMVDELHARDSDSQSPASSSPLRDELVGEGSQSNAVNADEAPPTEHTMVGLHASATPLNATDH